MPLLASFSSRDEFSNRYIAAFAHAPTVTFYPCDFMKRFRRQIACAAMWTTDHWHLFDHKKSCAFSVSPRYSSNMNTCSTTVFAASLSRVVPHIQYGYSGVKLFPLLL